MCLVFGHFLDKRSDFEQHECHLNLECDCDFFYIYIFFKVLQIIHQLIRKNKHWMNPQRKDISVKLTVSCGAFDN